MASIIWTLASGGESGTTLGLCLGAAAIVPFLAQKFFAPLRDKIKADPAAVLLYATATGATCCALLSCCEGRTFSLYLDAAALSIVFFASNQCIEMLLSLIVLDGLASPCLASRALQAIMTAGGCLGGLLAGMLLDGGGLVSASIACAGAYAAASLPVLPLTGAKFAAHRERYEKVQTAAAAQGFGRISVISAFVVLIALAGCIGAFNVCVPFIANKERFWSAKVFGLIDGCAAAGAFVATLPVFQRDDSSNAWRWAPATFLAAGFTLALSKMPFVAAVSALVWGFSMNVLRVRARTIFFKLPSGSEAARLWSARLTLTRVLSEAAAPAATGILIHLMKPSSALMCLLGLTTGIVCICHAMGAEISQQDSALRPAARGST